MIHENDIIKILEILEKMIEDDPNSKEAIGLQIAYDIIKKNYG